MEAAIKEVFRRGSDTKGGRLALRTAAPCNEYFTSELGLLSLFGAGGGRTLSPLGSEWRGDLEGCSDEEGRGVEAPRLLVDHRHDETLRRSEIKCNTDL